MYPTELVMEKFPDGRSQGFNILWEPRSQHLRDVVFTNGKIFANLAHEFIYARRKFFEMNPYWQEYVDKLFETNFYPKYRREWAWGKEYDRDVASL